MTNYDLENKISSAISEMVPENTFEKITAKIPAREERTRITMTKKKNNIIKILLPIAACLLLAVGIGGGTIYNNNFVIDSVIDIDVNPSVEITANKNDKVIDVVALNDDAKTIIGDMDLRKTDVNVAVNAIVGSMVKNGYVLNDENGILVTVLNDDTEKATKLRNEIVSDIDLALKENKADAAVINQTVSNTADAAQFAVDNNISVGKAVFIQKLAEKDSTLVPADLAKMSISELASIVNKNAIDISDIADYDIDDSIWENIVDSIDDINENEIAASADVISVADAKLAALAHASLESVDVTFIKAEYSIDDGRNEYDIEFIHNGCEYEYEIDAETGKVISCEKDANSHHNDKHNNTVTTTSPVVSENATKASETTTASIITAEKAKSMALAHAGADAEKVSFIKVELDHDDGRAEYDIEFICDNVDYEYEIDAITGNVISHEKEHAYGHH